MDPTREGREEQPREHRDDPNGHDAGPAPEQRRREECSSNRRKADTFRDYSENAPPGVREFYHLNHTRQTVDFVRATYVGTP